MKGQCMVGRKNWPASATALVGLFFAATLTMAATKAPIRWHSDPAKAHQLARTHRRPMLLFITTNGCHYCSTMKTRTFADPQVAADITSQFVAATVNGPDYATLTHQLGVKGYPTTVIISPDYRVLDSITGYVDARRFRQRLSASVDRHLVAMRRSSSAQWKVAARRR